MQMASCCVLTLLLWNSMGTLLSKLPRQTGTLQLASAVRIQMTIRYWPYFSNISSKTHSKQNSRNDVRAACKWLDAVF